MGEEAKQEQAKAEAKPEEKKEEKTEEKKEEPKPPEPFVLFVDLHCVGCAKKIEKSILRIRGVEGVVIDMSKNQVTIRGVVEPQAVCREIMTKTKRRTQVLSPLPAAEGEPIPEVVNSQLQDAWVSDLIDETRHCWNDNVLHMNFLEMDVEAIKQIPLCCYGIPDKLIWHYTRNGLFSVRSAYHLQMSLNGREVHGSGSVGQNVSWFWKLVWSLRIPSKIKVFAWKCCSNSLPVKSVLRHRHILQEDRCDGCGDAAETVMHCFWDCRKARDVWNQSPISFVIDLGRGGDFLDWAYGIGRRSDKASLGLFFGLCWGMWSSRNKALFSNVIHTATATVQMVCDLLQDFERANSNVRGISQVHGSVQWRPPIGEILKLNFDGALFMRQKICGVGVVIRDFKGAPIAALSEQIPQWMVADCIEAVAAVKALELAAELGLTNIQLEGDSLTVVKALQVDGHLSASFGHFIQYAITCSKQFSSFCVSHTRRSGNFMAHHLAQMAKVDSQKRVWLAEVPEHLLQALLCEVIGLTTVELNVNMHCEACAEQLKTKILKMRGVKTATTELSSGKVTVTGTMDPNRLVDYVYRRTKKQAKIVPQPQPEPEPEPEKPEAKPEEKKEAEKPAEEPKPEEEKKEGETAKKKPPEEEKKEEAKKEEEEQSMVITSDEQSMQRMMGYYQPLYFIERIPPPQLFSDENPNACCIT